MLAKDPALLIDGGTVRRASNIEPCNRMLRIAFYGVRWIGGSVGEMFTRRWKIEWRVNLQLSGGPTFGRFSDRSRAIEAEELWLVENNFGIDQ